jgi:endoglycosylceramidase
MNLQMAPAGGRRRQLFGFRRILAIGAASSALALAACGTSSPPEPIGDTSPALTALPQVLNPTPPWFTDEQGRVVVLHGTNFISKNPPYTPQSLGFGQRDIAFLAQNGFNVIRLGFIWAGVEPSPGQYDDAYIDQIEATATLAEEYGLVPMIDMHQDFYSYPTGGEGAPDWAVFTDGIPIIPLSSNAGLNGAIGLANAIVPFQNFWNDVAAPDGVGLQEHFAAAWQHIVARLSDDRHLVFDIFNEPYAGPEQFATCITDLGCPAFDTETLAPFYRKVLAAVRSADPTRTLLVEPEFAFGIGGHSYLPNFDDPYVAFAFHDYCATEVFGVPTGDLGCDSLDQEPLANAQEHYQATGETNIMNEFDANAGLDEMQTMMSEADQRMLSWVQWAYFSQQNHQAQTYGLVANISEGPVGDNVNQNLLAVLTGPYPRLVSGTPTAWNWDRSSSTFTASYSLTRADGKGSFPIGSTSEFFINPRFFPSGYNVALEGGTATSPANAEVLSITANNTTVSLTVTPAGSQ